LIIKEICGSSIAEWDESGRFRKIFSYPISIQVFSFLVFPFFAGLPCCCKKVAWHGIIQHINRQGAPMGETAYELLSLGLRYWFILLIALTLLRAFWLMRRDRREYHRMLRQLPDAGLIGEVVDLRSGHSQPLPREGLIGSGRSCDIRLSGLHRREMEFMFRSGLGLKLIPIHSKHHALLDGEALKKADAFALHGTVLDIRGTPLRFRLFAGLDLPQRQVSNLMETNLNESDDYAAGMPFSPFPDPLPSAVPPRAPKGSDLDMTWQYAPLPREIAAPPESFPQPAPRRSRRAGNHEDRPHE
jgi:hypothetical protein